MSDATKGQDNSVPMEKIELFAKLQGVEMRIASNFVERQDRNEDGEVQVRPADLISLLMHGLVQVVVKSMQASGLSDEEVYAQSKEALGSLGAGLSDVEIGLRGESQGVTGQ